MALYSIDIKLAATIYVRADNAAAALAIAEEHANGGFDFENGEGPPMSGLSYDNPNLPDVSISPAMTGHGLWAGDRVGVMVECE